ncbi:MAG TPA: hypothetical protein VJB57_10620, partial [Dehalococcoidia bacterium]|nr:hypothetical protein [Dehalococcoidia bacterium]
FNRSFVSLMALAWCAALAAAMYLIWDQSREIRIDSQITQLNFDLVLETQAEQILATIIAGALALPALLLLAMEITPQGSSVRYDRKREEEYGALKARADTLQKQLYDQRGQQRDLEKDYQRERGLTREEARHNADAVRTNASASRPVPTEERVTPSRRGWHLLPTRRA